MKIHFILLALLLGVIATECRSIGKSGPESSSKLLKSKREDVLKNRLANNLAVRKLSEHEDGPVMRKRSDLAPPRAPEGSLEHAARALKVARKEAKDLLGNEDLKQMKKAKRDSKKGHELLRKRGVPVKVNNNGKRNLKPSKRSGGMDKKNERKSPVHKRYWDDNVCYYYGGYYYNSYYTDEDYYHGYYNYYDCLYDWYDYHYPDHEPIEIYGGNYHWDNHQYYPDPYESYEGNYHYDWDNHHYYPDSDDDHYYDWYNYHHDDDTYSGEYHYDSDYYQYFDYETGCTHYFDEDWHHFDCPCERGHQNLLTDDVEYEFIDEECVMDQIQEATSDLVESFEELTDGFMNILHYREDDQENDDDLETDEDDDKKRQ